MFKLTLFLLALTNSILLVGHAASPAYEGRVAAYQKQTKPNTDCPPANKRNGRAAPCQRTPNASEEKGERSSKAGSKVLFDRTVF